MTQIRPFPPSDFYAHLPFGVLVVEDDSQKILFASEIMKKWLEVPFPETHDVFDLWDSLAATNLSFDSSIQIALKTKWVKVWCMRGMWDHRLARLFFADDISVDHENEIKLKAAIGEASAVGEMKSNFLATMSHEMRTPMQSVYGLLELMEFEALPPSSLEMVRTAKNSATGLLEILDDVLDLAKIEAEKVDLDLFEVPVRTLVTGIVEGLSVKTLGKSLCLREDISSDVPAVIIGDPKRLRQILMNLAGNALKFTEQGSVTIRVLVKDTSHLSVSETACSLRFEVVDTGIGMSEDVQNKLFQVFTQADSSTARKFGGTGLGLSICKKLVELMGGEIGVVSQTGKGSTFWFEIPTHVVIGESSDLTLPDLNGVSVLSVEDHPRAVKEISSSLRSMGAVVDSCRSMREAIDLVTRRPFDVGIIDYGLPDGNGLDVIRSILEVRPEMGLIMYTARDDSGLQHSLESLGVPYLAKPASRVGLGRAVLESASHRTHCSMHGPSRLLIAEDTPSVRDLLKRQLLLLGGEADFVHNGREALDAIASGQYGILLTDLHMPEMDGYDLVKAIRDREMSTGGHMPVIVLTADVQMAERTMYLGHGFDECLLKPVSLGHFKRLLVRWGLLDSRKEIVRRPSPAIDTASLIAQMGALDDNALEMLGLFEEMTRPLLEGLMEAFKRGDWKDLKEISHSLKGAARSAGALPLGNIAAVIQDKIEAGDKPSLEEIRQVEEEFQRVCEAIRAMRVVAGSF
jgi:two-component system sensor histidine kinase/response regulator